MAKTRIEGKDEVLTEEQIKERQKQLVAKIRKASISEIAHKIKDCANDDGKRCDEARFAVFLGAGASFSADIKTAGQMMAEFREKILRRDCPQITNKQKQEKWLEENIISKGEGNEYSKLFETFERTRNGRQKYISKLIKDKVPTFGYAMLASLVARGFINTVLTTNFDDLMFIACNKFTGVRPVIYAYGIMATEMKFSSPHSKILKMHGDYLYSTLANTESEMRLFNQDPNMKAQVNHALNEYELIVFGYSGSDDSVMNILEDYPGGKEFYWCHRSNDLPNLRVLELLNAKDGTLVAIEGFDESMYEIYKVVDFELNSVLASYEERRIEVLRFIDEFDKKYSTPLITEVIEERKTTEPKIKRDPETWFENLDFANQARNNGNIETAEKYYIKTIELNPNYSGSYINLGYLLSTKSARYEEAEKLFRKAIELDPNNSNAYVHLGYLLSTKFGKFEEAKELFRKAIELDPNNASAYANLGFLFSTIFAKFEEAEELFRKAIELDSNYPEAYNNLGWIAYKQGKEDEAINNFQTAVKLNERYLLSRLNLASIYKKLDKKKFLHKLLMEISSLITDEDHYDLAGLNAINGDKEKAFENLKLAINQDPFTKVKARQSIILEELRNDDRFWEIVGKD